MENRQRTVLGRLPGPVGAGGGDAGDGRHCEVVVKGEVMIDSIHQSSLGTMLRCGEQFRRRYVENEVIPPGIAAGRGTGVHKANEVNLKQKIQTGVDLPVSDLQDAARDGFVHAFRNGIYLPKEDVPSKKEIINQGLTDAVRLTRLYHDEVAPAIQPKEVERKFLIDVGLDLPLGGMIDIERDAKVDDLKTATKSWSEGRIQTEIQPVFYSYVHEKETGVRPEFVYQILVALKGSEKLQKQSMRAENRHYRALFAKLEIFMKMFTAGVFPYADPTWWGCSPKWCGYWYTCPGVGNSLPKRQI